MLRSNDPIKSYSSLQISHWPLGGGEPHASFVILMFPPSDQNCSKIITFILQPLILNRYLPNTFRSVHLIKRVESIHISHRARFGVLSPKTSFFTLMLSPWTQIVLLNLTFKLALRFKIFASNLYNWSEIFEYTPTFFVKMRHFWHHSWFLWGTYTLV